MRQMQERLGDFVQQLPRNRSTTVQPWLHGSIRHGEVLLQNKNIANLQGLVGNRAMVRLLTEAPNNRRPVALAVQRALPPGIPDTNDKYTAANDTKGAIYRGGRPVNFSQGFRDWILSYKGYAITTKQDVRLVQESGSQGYWLPEDAYQLDHQYPWAKIEKDLFRLSDELENLVSSGKVAKIAPIYLDYYIPVNIATNKPMAWTTPGLQSLTQSNQVSIYPTVYAARMYFHDVENIVPMTGSLNAAKSDSDIRASSNDDYELGMFTGRMTKKFYNFIDKVRDGKDKIAHKDALQNYVNKLGSVLNDM